LTLAVLLLAGTLAFAAGEGEGAASGDAVTLTMFAGLSPRVETLDSPDNEYTVWMEEKFGVKIEWVGVPSQERKQKQNLLLASGDYPEIFWAGDFSNAEQMRYGGQGLLQPLNDLIDHAPDILAAFEFKPYFRPEITTPDGNIYSLPHFEECVHCSVSQKLWINQSWLDKLGLPMPATTAELENTLMAFKTGDPNGNGLADEIPLTGSTAPSQYIVYNFLLSAFIYNDGRTFLYINDDGLADFAANKPQWRQGLRYLRRLYENGLIDPQAFTQDRNTARAVVNGDPTVVGTYSSGHLRGMARNEGLWQQYAAVTPLRGPEGVQYSAYYPSGVGIGKFAITDKATAIQAQKAIVMANWAYTHEGTVSEIWGVATNKEGAVNWRWAEPGELGLHGQPAIYWGSPHAWDRTSRTDSWGMELIFWHRDLFNGWAANQDVTQIEGYERLLYLESQKYLPYVPDELVPFGTRGTGGLYFTEDKSQRVAQITAEVANYVKQNVSAFIVGQRDLDADWDSYARGFDGLGLEWYLETIRDAMEAAAALNA
jgi:putative aldouronate transport system substrate-binding protein